MMSYSSSIVEKNDIFPPPQEDIENEEEIMSQTDQIGNKKQKISRDELAVIFQLLTHPTQIQHPTDILGNLDNINAVVRQLQRNPDAQQLGHVMLNAYHPQTDPSFSFANQTSSGSIATNNKNPLQNKPS